MPLDYLYLIVAENVMNWTQQEFPYSEENQNPVRYWVNERGEKMHRVNQWLPDRNLEHAFQVIHYLKTKGYRMQLTQTEEHLWHCEFKNKEQLTFSETHENEKIAICLAALEISAKEKTEETISES